MPPARGSVRSCLSPPPGVDEVPACREAAALDLPAARAVGVRLALARALVRHERFLEAVEAYRDAARIAPDDPDAHLRVGEALLTLAGDARAAAEEVQVALRLDPQSARAYGVLGVALHAQGEHPEAAAAFAEAERLDPAYFTNRPAEQAMAEASRRGASWPDGHPAADVGS